MPAPLIDGRETRAILTPLELRAADDGSVRTGHGYAALFDTWTDIGGMWRERIAPGAFTKSLQERDVLALHSHDSGRVVGRKGAGTLILREDSKGLAFENPLPDTNDGRDLIVQLERQDIAGMSIGFVSVRSEWDETKDVTERTILEALLFEITYTAYPAYRDTEVALRSLERVRDERRDHNRVGAEIRMAARRARQAHLERRL